MARSDSKGPGDQGSMQGQIKTPMCSENVGNKGGGQTQSYSKVTSAFSGSKGSGKSDSSIYGPGTKGKLKG